MIPICAVAFSSLRVVSSHISKRSSYVGLCLLIANSIDANSPKRSLSREVESSYFAIECSSIPMISTLNFEHLELLPTSLQSIRVGARVKAL
jgi:hypothetical protein